MVEQARMLVRGEEARFIATQSRATTLLAVGGVLAGIGATVAFHFAEGRFPWPWHPLGVNVSTASVIAIALTVAAVGSLIWASAIALGALRRCGVWMGLAVATGLTASVFALAVSSPSYQGTDARASESSPDPR